MAITGTSSWCPIFESSQCNSFEELAPVDSLVAITETSILVPYLWVKSLQLIWRLGTRRWHLRVPDLPMSCRDLTPWLYEDSCPISFLGSPYLTARRPGASKTTSQACGLEQFIFSILYKQIEELQNSRIPASVHFEKRGALHSIWSYHYLRIWLVKIYGWN